MIKMKKNKVYEKVKKIYILFLFAIILSSCNKKHEIAKMNNIEIKIYESLLIGKNKVPSFESKVIKGVYNLIEDRENFVIINISDNWYVLAIDTYDEMKNNHDNSKMMEIDGWRYTLKAKKGDIAKAPDLLVDMAKSHIDDYKNDIDIELLNKALGLKYVGNS